MSETQDFQQVKRELSRAAQTIAMVSVELARTTERKKLDQLKEQQKTEKDQQQEMLRGAPTKHQQTQWQQTIGAGDAVALQYHDQIYTGTIATNPNRAGDMSVEFDDPNVGAAIGDVWNRAELKVRQPGETETKTEAPTQPQPASEQRNGQKTVDRENLIIGDWVHAADGDNYGTIITEPKNGTAKVHFINQENGGNAKVDLDVDLLTLITPAEHNTKTPNNDTPKNETNKPQTQKTKTEETKTETKQPKQAETGVKQQPAATAEQVAEWQTQLGRGDQVRTSKGGRGTITTNPKDEQVTVYFANQTNNTEKEFAIATKDLKVIKPGDPKLKQTNEPFTVQGPNQTLRTVKNGPAIPDKTRAPKPAAQIRRPDMPLIQAKKQTAPKLDKNEATQRFAEIKTNLGPRPFNEKQAAQHNTTKQNNKQHQNEQSR